MLVTVEKCLNNRSPTGKFGEYVTLQLKGIDHHLLHLQWYYGTSPTTRMSMSMCMWEGVSSGLIWNEWNY